MKKFYSFLFAAVALVGFAACNSDSTEEPAPAGVEKVSFKANIEETKTGLVDNKTVWADGDNVTVANDEVGSFVFTYKEETKTFDCEAEGVKDLLGKEVTAAYNEGKLDSTAGVAGAILKTTKAVVLTENAVLNFAVESAFLKFTTTGTVTLKGTNGLFSAASIEIAEAGEHYVAINPVNAVLSYEVNGIVGKSTTITFEKQKIYNLGKLSANVVYMRVNADAWKQGNERYAAYFWNGEGDEWVDMVATNVAFIYACVVPVDVTNVIFCRMNGAEKENNWDNKWDQTNDLTVTAEKNLYTITASNEGKASGEWGSCVVPTTLYLKPNSNWKVDNARFAAYFFGNGEKWVSMTKSDKDGIYEVEIPNAYTSVIFCRMNPSAAANNWDNKWNQTGNLTIPIDGKNLYTVKDGTWDNGGGTWSKK